MNLDPETIKQLKSSIEKLKMMISNESATNI
jgi:hypothetical protein